MTSELVAESSVDSGISPVSTKRRPRISFTYPWKKLLKNETFCSRIIIIPPAIFILLLCICYTISAILQLELDNYWCDNKVTLEDIREHSITEGLPEGMRDRCWGLTDIRNENLLWSRQSYGYHWVYNATTISRFILLLIPSITLTILIVYYLIQLVMDIRKYRKGKLSVKIRQERASKKISCCKKYFIMYIKWWSKTFGLDTGNWIILKVFGETFEILMQSQALWAYNGTPIINTDTLYLAIDKKYIILFAVFLFLNCISGAIMWLFYAFKPRLCHGLLFKLLLIFVDVLYDVFYAFFPILTILLNHQELRVSSFLVSLASLETDNSLSIFPFIHLKTTLILCTQRLTFCSTFVPLIFLVYKFYLVSRKAQLVMTEYFQVSSRLQKERTSNIEMTDLEFFDEPSLPKQKTVDVMSNRASATITKLTQSWVDGTAENREEIYGWRNYINHIYFRKFAISLISIFFTIYGTVILVVVLTHFNQAVPYCNKLVSQFDAYHQANDTGNVHELSLDTDLFSSRPELFFWDSCLFKVYPFDTTCDCRVFRFRVTDKNVIDAYDPIEAKTVFNIDILASFERLMSTFRMMEKFELESIRSMFDGLEDAYLESLDITTKLNITDDIFNAKKLQILVIDFTPTTTHLSEKIGDLEFLQYLSIVDTELTYLPESLTKLTNLQYITLRGWDAKYEIEELPTLCSLTKLKAIRIEGSSKIKEISYCLSDMENLEIVYLINLPSLNNISLDIFGLPNLRQLNLEATGSLSLDFLISSSNIDGDSIFYPNKNARYELESSGLCLSITESNMEDIEIYSNYKRSFIEFLRNSTACEQTCGSSVFALDCGARHWQDGVCQNPCNNKQCGFDGGDCIQLCVFQDVEKDYLKLGNNECDIEFNKTECNYDNCDCIPDTYYQQARYEDEGCIPLILNATACNITYNNGEHDCNPKWVNDDWCDSNCQNIAECAFDGDDCNDDIACTEESNCQRVNEIFSRASNFITDDGIVQKDELCGIWIFIQGQVDRSIRNCTVGMKVWDQNADGVLEFFEGMGAVSAEFGLTSDKADQIDCSACQL